MGALFRNSPSNYTSPDFLPSVAPSFGKFSEQETLAYAQSEQVRQTILGPWEARVEKSAIQLKEIMDARDDEVPFNLEDLEFQFNILGHGLVAQHVFGDVEDTADILNGCESFLT